MKSKRNNIRVPWMPTLLTLACAFLASSALAQEAQEKRYIPPSEYPENVYFGDAHVHTVMSLDAAAWGTTQTPEDSYRYARGEEVTSFKGWKTQLTRLEHQAIVERISTEYIGTGKVKCGSDFSRCSTGNHSGCNS